MENINLSRGIIRNFFDLKAADTFYYALQFQDDLKVPIDIMGWTFVYTIATRDSCDTLVSKVLTAGSGLTIAINGFITISALLGLPPGKYVHALVGTDTDGIVTTWVSGQISLK